MTVSDGVSPSPKGGGGAGSTPSKSAIGIRMLFILRRRQLVAHEFFFARWDDGAVSSDIWSLRNGSWGRVSVSGVGHGLDPFINWNALGWIGSAKMETYPTLIVSRLSVQWRQRLG